MPVTKSSHELRRVLTIYDGFLRFTTGAYELCGVIASYDKLFRVTGEFLWVMTSSDEFLKVLTSYESLFKEHGFIASYDGVSRVTTSSYKLRGPIASSLCHFCPSYSALMLAVTSYKHFSLGTGTSLHTVVVLYVPITAS